LQRCENCNSQFSWSQIYKSWWWVYRPIKCEHCCVKHKITIVGRFTFVALTILLMLVFMFFLTPFNHVWVTFGIGILIFMIGSLLTPFVLRYEKER